LLFLTGIAAAILTVVSIAKKKTFCIGFLAVPAGFYSITGFTGSVINLFFNNVIQVLSYKTFTAQLYK